MENQLVLEKAIADKDVGFIAETLYGFELSEGQKDIVRKIAFREHKRVSISAMTRYGKTQCVALGIAIMIDMGFVGKIAFIGPKQEQAGLLRQYMAELILKNQSLLKKAQLNVEGAQKIQREASRKRMTFSTGAEYRVFSAEGDADRLMGFGADVVVKDEACLINRTAHTKIMRMLGDDPDNAILIELYNPWDRDNIAFEHTLDPKFHKIHIGWKQAVRENRTTQEFIEERRKEFTPLEFTVLYDSKFPVESEDSIYNLDRINEAEKREFNFQKEINELFKRLENEPREKDHILQDLKQYRKIVSCDPADKGRDFTVMYWGIQKGRRYEITGSFNEPKSDQMEIIGRMFNKAREITEPQLECDLKIDRIGIGSGDLSRMIERANEPDNKRFNIVGCHYGERASMSDRFVNKKAENFFKNRDIFKEGLISIPKIQKLKSQLVAMKWGRGSTEKIKIFDPGDAPGARKTDIKSPDFADALVYFTWSYTSKVEFGTLSSAGNSNPNEDYEVGGL